MATHPKEAIMSHWIDGRLLRIYVGESDHWHGKPAYEAIVLAAREAGLAGATMLRGLMGYGAASRIHTAKILRLSEDLPVVIEIIDTAVKIEAFLPTAEAVVQGGLIMMESVRFVERQAKPRP